MLKWQKVVTLGGGLFSILMALSPIRNPMPEAQRITAHKSTAADKIEAKRRMLAFFLVYSRRAGSKSYPQRKRL